MSAVNKIENEVKKSNLTFTTGDAKYDNDIFPKVQSGKIPFNWMAGLFPHVWYAHKGMWKQFALYTIPLAFALSFSQVLNLPIALIGLAIGSIVGIGKIANKEYFDFFTKNPSHKSNAWAGVGGLAIFLFVSAFTDGFAGSFVPAFKQSFNRAAQSSAPAQRNVASASIYDNSAMAIMDGEKAVNRRLHFTGMFSGIQSIDGRPIAYVMDAASGTAWIIPFSEAQKANVASLEMGTQYDFECTIQRVGAMNICYLE